MAQRARLGPFAVADARHQYRLDESRLARRLAAFERAGVALPLGEHAADAIELALVEPGPDAAGVREHAVLVHPDHQRAELRGAAPLARQPAADDHIGLEHVLDLDPAGRTPAGVVRAVEPLGDDALEP